MSELETLLRQKKEIESRIKELKNTSLRSCGVAKYEKDPEDQKYRLSIAGKQTRKRYETKHQFKARCKESESYYFDRKELGQYEQDFWYTLIRTENKQNVIEYIEKVIVDFTEIRKVITKEED